MNRRPAKPEPCVKVERSKGRFIVRLLPIGAVVGAAAQRFDLLPDAQGYAARLGARLSLPVVESTEIKWRAGGQGE